MNMRVARTEGDFSLRLINRVHALFPFSMPVNSPLVGWLRGAGVSPARLFPLAAIPLVIVTLIK